MSNEEYQILLAAYLSGNISEDDRNRFEAWVHASDESMRAVEEARNIWDHSSMRLSMDDSRADEEWAKLQSRINGRGDARQANLIRNHVLRFAAALTLLFVAYWVIKENDGEQSGFTENQAFLSDHTTQSEVEAVDSDSRQVTPESKTEVPGTKDHASKRTKESMVAEEKLQVDPNKVLRRIQASESEVTLASDDEVIHLFLPDSTQVWLNRNSTLSYQIDFGERFRKVELRGEAYFMVKKDTTRTFLVHANTITARVVGTAFNVKTVDNTTTVTVAEGRVEVLSDKTQAQTLLLIPGDQAIVRNSLMPLKTRNVDAQFDAWRLNKAAAPVMEAEENQPDLSVLFTSEKNSFNQSVVSGSLQNNTKDLTYKNVTLRITSVRPDGTKTTNFITVYQTVSPGQTVKYRTALMDMFVKTKVESVEIDKAQIIANPVR